MYVYLYIALTLLIPLLSFIPVWLSKNWLTYYFFIAMINFLLTGYFIYSCGAWPYLGYNWRIISGLIYIFLLFIKFYRKRKIPAAAAYRKKPVASVCITLIAGAMMYLNLEARQNYSTNLPPIELQFPLRNGTYAIQQGGNNEIGNVAHRRHIPESLAMDIVKLNDHQRRCTDFFSTSVSDYAIYGDTVVSPCDAVVMGAFDGIEDNIPPVMNTDNRGGNHVVLRYAGVNIILCHMQLHSIMVKKGQHIKAGTPIGLVGNTGYSIEPHLHIQAFKKGIYSNQQVPIQFDGRFLKLNDVYESD